jgi:hypothetical protein
MQIIRLICGRNYSINMFYYVSLFIYTDRWNIKPERNSWGVLVNLLEYELNRLNQWLWDDNDLVDFSLLDSLLNSSFD